MRTRGVLDDREFGVMIGKPCDASVTIGGVTLSRTQDGWVIQVRDYIDLAQLDAAVQLAKQVPAAPVASAESALTIVGEEDDGDTLSDARDLLQRHAETNGDGDLFGGPDVEFGEGTLEDKDPVYGVHVLAEAKLKELVQSDVLKVQIKMLKIGDEYVPDRTFSGVTVTDETYVEWKRDTWPVWKLSEDGYVKLSADGTTAKITRRGRVLLKQIADGLNCVYGSENGDEAVILADGAPPVAEE